MLDRSDSLPWLESFCARCVKRIHLLLDVHVQPAVDEWTTILDLPRDRKGLALHDNDNVAHFVA